MDLLSEIAADKAANLARINSHKVGAAYSCGPFSRVDFFFTLKRGLRTFTSRVHREDTKGVMLQTISNTFAGGPSFNDRFVDTSSLCKEAA